jgi:unsaturated rhamnogalacturonyl hydrolase
MRKKAISLMMIIAFTFVPALHAQIEYAQQVVESTMKRVTPSGLGRWVYITGFYLFAEYRVWKATGNDAYLQYIKEWVNDHVDEDGNIDRDIWSLDNCQPGLVTLSLYVETGEEKYKLAADHIRNTLKTFPRTSDGGFFHDTAKKGQLWLDGAYMVNPFLVKYGQVFGDTTCYTEAANQIIIYASHLKDDKTGLLYHAYDEDGSEAWADSVTHHSPCFWGRSIGWFGMAIVEILDVIPKDHPKRPALIRILTDLIKGVSRYQDKETGLWYQMVDKPDDPDNWQESSCSCMFTYFIARAVAKGYVGKSYQKVAMKGYEGILQNKFSVDSDGYANLKDISAGTMVRGDCSYYAQRPRNTNDLHGLGAFVMMCWQMSKDDAK